MNVDSDNAIARLKEDMRTHKINYTDITKPDPVNHPEMVVVKGLTRTRAATSRASFPTGCRIMTRSSGAENSWTVAMKPQSLVDLKESRGGAGDRDHPESN